MKLLIQSNINTNDTFQVINFGFLPDENSLLKILEYYYDNDIHSFYNDISKVYISGTLKNEHKSLTKEQFCSKYPSLSSRYTSCFNDMHILYGQTWNIQLNIKDVNSKFGIKNNKLYVYYNDEHNKESTYAFDNVEDYNLVINQLDIHPICIKFDCSECKT